ncbi:hypothetical protein KBI23_15900 [bacterium]|nr:hypothetical protein [bacterium]MBP9807416.1 hypothetical protein [bacterium]
MSLHVGLEGKPEVRRKQNVPVLAPFAIIDEDFAAAQINVTDSDADHSPEQLYIASARVGYRRTFGQS